MRVATVSLRHNRFAWGCGLLLLVAVGSGWWLQRPSYLELPIAVKPSSHRHSFWEETHFTQVHYSDSWGADYICRKRGHAYGGRQGWKTTTDAMEFFHSWLEQRGWRYQKNSSLRDSILPEGRFLQNHVQYRVYTRSGHHFWEGPWVAVAVDPAYDGAFDVTLITVQSSWLRELDKSFD